MPEFQTVRPGETGQGLFSAAEIEGLMRVEFERAARHNFPLVCMRVAVDRLGQLQDLYGAESRGEIVRAVIGMLRASVRDSDHLGATDDGGFLVVFPHTTPETGALLAKRLLANAKKLRFDRDGRSLRVSLSIGVAHNRAESATSFETLLGVAQEGLVVADAGGGDRFVETELYHLFEQQKQGSRRGRPAEPVLAASTTGAGDPSATGRVPSREELFGRALLDVLVAQGFDAESVAALSPHTITAAIQGFRDQRELAVAVGGEEKQRQIEMLERRIAKLTAILGITEEELKRVAAMKGIDLGVASIYRTVQGLADDASNAERKREMMKTIFEANFKLKKDIRPDPEPPAA